MAAAGQGLQGRLHDRGSSERGERSHLTPGRRPLNGGAGVRRRHGAIYRCPPRFSTHLPPCTCRRELLQRMPAPESGAGGVLLVVMSSRGKALRPPHRPRCSPPRRRHRCSSSPSAGNSLQVLEPGRPDVERVPVRRLRGLSLDIRRKVDGLTRRRGTEGEPPRQPRSYPHRVDWPCPAPVSPLTGSAGCHSQEAARRPFSGPWGVAEPAPRTRD